ncbi:hypothetical protein ABNX05_19655 [Lysinibacillus sp. M3]|uniref:Uncharacterized protein n=1 Tax=Lysinibacillus zambalensis TaxID=3160866 RepID=A0ABV1MZ50_9BACI
MQDLSLEVKNSFDEYIKKVPEGCLEIAKLLRLGEIRSSMQIIQQFSEGMSWLLQASNLLSVNGIDTKFNIEQIENFLKEINDGLIVEDYMLVADLFEYEIASYFNKTD